MQIPSSSKYNVASQAFAAGMRMAVACALASLAALSKDDCLGASKNEVSDGYRFES
ncbi:hypothetical protein Tco_0342498, partial [Tanacetum coccineum]